MNVRTTVLGAAVLFAANVGLGSAAAQTGVPMPSPWDVAIEPWDREVEKGACGLGLGGEVYDYLQKIYSRAGQCSSYGQQYDRKGDKVVWVNYRYDTPKPHSIQGFFSYYGVDWWDGWLPPEARGSDYDANVVGWPQGLTPHSAMQATPQTPATKAAAPTAREASAAPASQSAAGDLGACGFAYSTDAMRQVQETSAQNGMCDWYEANVCKKDGAC